MVADTSQLKQTVPVVHNDEVEHRRQISNVVNRILDGATNAVGSVTLTENSTTTTLNDIRIGVNSRILLMARTATAAAEMTSLYITPTKESATITHSSTADTDKTFDYVILGG